MSDDGFYDYAADAYADEIRQLKDHIERLLRQLEGVPVKHPQQSQEREAARRAVNQ